MNSPFTGGEVIQLHERRQTVFRKETFEYEHRFFRCKDTGETFTTTQLDEVNLSQVYNQYRVKYGIPFPDEIRATRTRYGFSASKMSRILGFGENTYRLYENGDMPSVAHGKTLMAIQSPSVFQKYLEDANNEITASELNEFSHILQQKNDAEKYSLVFGPTYRGPNNGYTSQSLSKLKNVLLFFIEKLNGVFVTKMNKLLFFSDFVSYRDYGQAITGLSYKAIQYGPVPDKWNVAYGMIDDIEQVIIDMGNGYAGQKLTSRVSFDATALTPQQLGVLERVCNAFGKESSNGISEISHREPAWIENVENHQIIDFRYAFVLKCI